MFSPPHDDYKLICCHLPQLRQPHVERYFTAADDMFFPPHEEYKFICQHLMQLRQHRQIQHSRRYVFSRHTRSINLYAITLLVTRQMDGME